jgi:hypothetical protein
MVEDYNFSNLLKGQSLLFPEYAACFLHLNYGRVYILGHFRRAKIWRISCKDRQKSHHGRLFNSALEAQVSTLDIGFITI